MPVSTKHMPRGIQDPAWTGMGASTINPSMSFEWTFRGISSYISWLCITGHVHDSNQMHHRKEHEQLRKTDILVCKSKREYPHYTLSNHLLLSLDSIMRRPITSASRAGEDSLTQVAYCLSSQCIPNLYFPLASIKLLWCFVFSVCVFPTLQIIYQEPGKTLVQTATTGRWR